MEPLGIIIAFVGVCKMIEHYKPGVGKYDDRNPLIDDSYEYRYSCYDPPARVDIKPPIILVRRYIQVQ